MPWSANKSVLESMGGSDLENLLKYVLRSVPRVFLGES